LPLVLPEASAVGRRSERDEGERRTDKVTVMLTPSERAELDERAASAGVKLSDYVRAAALGYRINVRNPLTEKAFSELGAGGMTKPGTKLI
jgi:hypothetical protein